ncbi:hypothetical protein IW261DRAFT_801384 [Armillaria novae-zelandiae]|uniref:DUF6535 domain-containing protein n=1 Tax=Armillaria novae-zelandiae TaxID=153914 RepID=A0AA39UES4_9AGAR|nr:hypothetical protein IW261DRAFT_801384 [Armillaria novae-zelandiae]
MSDPHRVDEVSRRRSSEGISDIQGLPGGSSQSVSPKLHQNNEDKPKEMGTDKENINSDSIGVEPVLSPGIQEKAGVEGDRGAERSRPDPGLKTGNDPYNYEEKYPKDKIYEETAPNARVWRTYVDESKNHDARMDRESRESLDVLLVFAGLFSAVVTTFVAQTSQSLQADYAQISASLLFEMVLIQRAIANGSSPDNVPLSSLNPYTKFTPATMDVWVNGLWFTSLSLSLATALVAVLVKQWLHHYLALPSGTPQERSHVRQYRYGGFEKWHVLVIVGLLPVLMHLALGIFFVGLTIFLVPLRPGFSWVIGVGTVAAYAMYLITIFLPILYSQCPYRTPLSDLVYFSYYHITHSFFPKHLRPLFVKAVQRRNSFLDDPGAKISSLDDLERGVVQNQSDTLSVEALHWLFSSSSNPTVHVIVIQAIGGLPVSAMAAVKTVFGEAIDIRRAQDTLLDNSTQYVTFGVTLRPLPGMEFKVEHLLRFELFIPHLYSDMDNPNKYLPYIDAADDGSLAVAVQSNNARQRSIHKPSDSSTSTAFFQQMLFSNPWPVLPPVIWLGLMRAAKGDGAFAAIDIDSLDIFPLHLHGYILKDLLVQQDSSSLVCFEEAVTYHFPEEFATNMLNMLSVFNKLADKTSFPTAFTLALASIRYLLHRISLSPFDIDTEGTLMSALRLLELRQALDELPDEQIAAFSDLMEDAIVHSPVFKPKPKWTHLQMSLVKVYSVMVGAKSLPHPMHKYWPALRPLVEFLIIQYDAPPYDDDRYFAPFDDMCDILAFGLRHGVQTVYNVFLETRCLDVFGDHSLRPSLVRVINGYVAGLAARHASIDSQRHLDYLHEPENLFLACCVLASNRWEDYSGFTSEIAEIVRARPSETICRDIRALASLRPSDPSWEQCRRKLRDLLQDDGGEFFIKQQKWTGLEFEVFNPEAVDKAKSNIRLVLDELDGFFSDLINTNIRLTPDAPAQIDGVALLMWYISISPVPWTSRQGRSASMNHLSGRRPSASAH